jgi:hypothetical protein
MACVTSVLVLAGFLIGSGAALAASVPADICQAAKLRAAGKEASCLMKAQAKTILGKAGDTAKCETTLLDAFVKLDAKGGCGTSGDGPLVSSRIVVSFDLTNGVLSPGSPFTDLGDGTVVDSRTGLQWEKKTAGSGTTTNPHGVDSFWSWGDSNLTPNGTVFTQFLAFLNRSPVFTQFTTAGAPTASAVIPPFAFGGCFAGHCDWRLPTAAELQTIIDPSVPDCAACRSFCVDPAFDEPPTLGLAAVWTSEVIVESPPFDVIAVNMCGGPGVLGVAHPFDTINVTHARAVRSVSAVHTTARCAPTTCAAQSANCGTIGDGCGNALDCGTCSGLDTCGGGGVPNQCGCTPTTCAAQGDANCGSLPDGCGGTLDCGTCTPPLTCGGDGRPNHCGIIL